MAAERHTGTGNEVASSEIKTPKLEVPQMFADSALIEISGRLLSEAKVSLLTIDRMKLLSVILNLFISRIPFKH